MGFNPPRPQLTASAIYISTQQRLKGARDHCFVGRGRRPHCLRLDGLTQLVRVT